jgi:ABC-type multidrug transport system fused ATPase/permease subunit
MALKDILLKVGAPALRSMVEGTLGGFKGKLAGMAIGALADAFKTDPNEADIERAILADPAVATPIIQRIEDDFSEAVKAMSGAMIAYNEVLTIDAKAEGFLQRTWRPIFALVFSISFFAIIFTVARAVWTNQIDAISSLSTLTGFLIALFTTGAAVLGVYVWRRSDEKGAGVAGFGR